MRNGDLKSRYVAPVGAAQAGGVRPRRGIYEGKGYLPISLMQFSRGCRFGCDFCAISAFFKKSHFVRRTQEVLDEIAAQERKTIFFVDDNFLAAGGLSRPGLLATFSSLHAPGID